MLSGRGRPRFSRSVLPLVFGAEQAAALQFRDHQLDEIVERARQIRRHDVEAVAGAFDEPLLHVVGDLLGRADEHDLGARAGHPLAELADRQLLPPRHRDDAVERALAAVGRRQIVRQRLVQRILGQVDVAEHGRQDLAPDHRVDQRLDEVVVLVRLCLGRGHDHAQARHDLEMIGIAAVFAHAAP